MIALLRKVADKLDVERRSANADLALLAARIADGTANEIEVGKLLKHGGHTLADIETAVVRQQRFAELTTIVLGLPDAVRLAEQAAAEHAEFCLRRQTTTLALNAEWTDRTLTLNATAGVLAECRNAERELLALTGSTIHDVVEAG